MSELENIARLGGACSLASTSDIESLIRFHEICNDADAGGHDLSKEAISSLEKLGALRSCGFGRHEITSFGDWLISMHSPAEATDDSNGIRCAPLKESFLLDVRSAEWALKLAAKVIELYDDAEVAKHDFMLASTGCAEIIEALIGYLPFASNYSKQIRDINCEPLRKRFEEWHLKTFKHAASSFSFDQTQQYFQDPVWIAAREFYQYGKAEGVAIALAVSDDFKPEIKLERRFNISPTPPLSGRWHHGNGTLVCGTIRIASFDYDTEPSKQFQDEMANWICETLDAAILSSKVDDELQA